MHCAPCTPEITFCVVENRYLQCVESIFVNLPQFAKFGLKESLNRFFSYFSLVFWSGIEPFCFVSICFTVTLSMAAPSKRTVGRSRPRRRGLPKYIRLRESLFSISGEMGKKLLAANSTASVFAANSTDSDKTVRSADSTLCKHNFSCILSRTHT